MALGRQRERQSEMLVTGADLPRSPGHAFYDRLQAELLSAGFDAFVEEQCARYYAARRGRPSLPPGRYFRMGSPRGYYRASLKAGSRPATARGNGACELMLATRLAVCTSSKA
jgi:hypothetical protein